MFIISKHIFYDLIYTITMFNTINKMTKNVFNN